MSIITLSSDGQSPSNFHSFFPQGLNFGRYAEVSIMGYSGLTRVQPTNDPDAPEIGEWIINNTNDTFMVYIGEVGSNADNIYYKPTLIKLDHGTYSATGLKTQVEAKYAVSQNLNPFKRMTLTGPGVGQAMNIKITKFQGGVVNELNSLINYQEMNEVGVIQLPPHTLLEPFDAGPTNKPRSMFIDLERSWMGDNGRALGAGNPEGLNMDFITPDTNYSNYACSWGLVPESWISKAKRGQNKSLNLVGDPTSIIKPQDFAITEEGEQETYIHAVAGFQIDTDGFIYVIADNVNGDKSQRVKYATGVNLGAAGAKFFNIDQRVDANNRPVIQFQFDVGAGLVLAPNLPSGNGTIPLFPYTSPHAIYRHTDNLYAGVVFNPNTITATTNAASFRLQQLHSSTGIATGNYADRTTLVWENWDTKYNGGNYITINSNLANADVVKLSEECNMKSTLGFFDFFAAEIAGQMSAVGLTGASTDLPSTQDIITQPLIITSPDLNAKGYVGAGAGGGAEAQIIGVMNTTSDVGVNQQHFCETGLENWIKLNNAYPFTINRLQIIIKDFRNQETNILQPTTHLWMKVKCEGQERDTKTITTGSFSANY